MGKKNKKDQRIEYMLSDFFVKKLTFENNILKFGTNTRLKDVCVLLGLNQKTIAKKLGLNPSQEDHILDDEQVAEIALIKNINFEKINDVSAENVLTKINNLIQNKSWNKEVTIEKKPPIITIMGHVDHGKTTLLDVIRNSSLVKSEAGGITQRIGAYQVKIDENLLTFIDTPGHEAFTEMRANGSLITDMAIIVIAANDSLMNQTKESIDHAKAAGVPLIVAVNKIDMPGADVEKVKQDLVEYGVIPDEWGGDTTIVEISALKKKGIDNLLEAVILQSELLALKAPVNILGSGTIIESNLSQKRGNLVSVIVQNGTLKIGDNIVIDDFTSKIKAMHNDRGEIMKQATPGTPVEIYGISSTPMVGSNFVVFNDSEAAKIAKVIHESRLNKLRKQESKLSIQELFSRKETETKDFNIILKADALGVLKAISSKVENLSNDEVKINIIRQDVGEITNTDISLAEASKALIYTFETKIPPNIEAVLKQRGIWYKNFKIIYEMFDDITNKVLGLEDDRFEFKKIGELQILQLFHFSKIGKIAGCRVMSGLVKRNSVLKVIRKDKELFNGEIETLKIIKDNVKEVKKGQECGVTVKGFNDFEISDIIEVYEKIKIN